MTRTHPHPPIYTPPTEPRPAEKQPRPAVWVATSADYPQYHLAQIDGTAEHVVYLDVSDVDDETSWELIVANHPPEGDRGGAAFGFVVDADSPSDIDSFESRCDFLAEESRILAAEAMAEFG